MLQQIFYIVLLGIGLVPSFAQKVVLNEVQYTNRNTLFDAKGNTPDWVEVYNTSLEPINLSGYGLADKLTETEPWYFPEKMLNPGEFLVIYLSGENTISESEVHADFSIRIMEEPVVLLNPNGEIIDVVEPLCVPADKSYGFTSDGTGERRVLSPTPGKSNEQAEAYTINFQPDTLWVNHPGGFYKDMVELTLSNSVPENEICYTLDGDEPNDKSESYHTSLTLTNISGEENRFANKTDYDFKGKDLISKANIVRAQVYSAGCPASNVISNTYFVNVNADKQYKVPVVSIITEKDNLFDDEIGIYVEGDRVNYYKKGKAWERPAHIEIFDKTGSLLINQDAGIRIHGRGSRGAPQKSFRLYAREEYGDSVFNYPLLDQKPHIKSYKTMLLRATRDWSGTAFKDELGQHIVQDMTIDYPAASTVVAFVNGEYWGIHSLRERHDEYYVANNYKIPPVPLNIIAHDIDKVVIEEGTIDAFNELTAFLENSDPESEFFYTEVNEKIDLKNFTDFYLAQLYLANVDFPYNNFEMWRVDADTARWRFFFFDLDGAMQRANYDHLMEYNNTYDDFNRYPDYATFILRTLLQNPQFNREFNARYSYLLQTEFSAERVIDLVDAYQELYAPLMSDHIYRWNNPSDYTKWLHNVDMLRQFAIQRPLYAYEQLTENFGNPFEVYPNPSSGEVNIDFFDIPNSAQLVIYNLQGVPLYQRDVSHGMQQTVYPELPSGVYILKVMLGEWNYAERLIVN